MREPSPETQGRALERETEDRTRAVREAQRETLLARREQRHRAKHKRVHTTVNTGGFHGAHTTTSMRTHATHDLNWDERPDSERERRVVSPLGGVQDDDARDIYWAARETMRSKRRSRGRSQGRSHGSQGRRSQGRSQEGRRCSMHSDGLLLQERGREREREREHHWNGLRAENGTDQREGELYTTPLAPQRHSTRSRPRRHTLPGRVVDEEEFVSERREGRERTFEREGYLREEWDDDRADQDPGLAELKRHLTRKDLELLQLQLELQDELRHSAEALSRAEMGRRKEEERRKSVEEMWRVDRDQVVLLKQELQAAGRMRREVERECAALKTDLEAAVERERGNANGGGCWDRPSGESPTSENSTAGPGRKRVAVSSHDHSFANGEGETQTEAALLDLEEGEGSEPPGVLRTLFECKQALTMCTQELQRESEARMDAEARIGLQVDYVNALQILNDQLYAQNLRYRQEARQREDPGTDPGAGETPSKHQSHTFSPMPSPSRLSRSNPATASSSFSPRTLTQAQAGKVLRTLAEKEAQLQQARLHQQQQQQLLVEMTTEAETDRCRIKDKVLEIQAEVAVLTQTLAAIKCGKAPDITSLLGRLETPQGKLEPALDQALKELRALRQHVADSYADVISDECTMQ